MNSLIVQLLASEKLNRDNYTTWKSNLNTILVVDDLRFVLTEECPQTPASNANRTSREAYDRWIKANEKARVYILASMSDVLAKKHESLATAKEIMDSLKGMFGQPKWSLRHKAIKYIYTKRMKEGTSIREHVLYMMIHFNIAEVNGGAIDEANQVSFILESLPKSFIPFQTNVSLNKIEFNLTTLLNELQRFQNLTMGKAKEMEANIATTKGKFSRGSSSKSKVGPSKPNRKIEKKGKGKTPKQNKGKKTQGKGKCYHCGENGHSLINCPKYLTQKKAEKEAQDKYDLLVLETCLVENENSTWILDSGATNHICFSFQENSSWKNLSEGKITLKVGTGEMVSAKVVGDLKLFFNDRYIMLKNVLIGRLVKSRLLSQLEDNSLPPCDSCLREKMTKRSFTGKGKTIKTLRSDRGGEYMGLQFQDYLIEHEIQSQLSTPNTPQQNSVSERRNRTLLDMVRFMMSFAQLPDSFWGYALETAIYILNNVPSKSEAQIAIPDNGIEDPLTYKQTMNDMDCDQWVKAIDLKMESMYSNSVWTLVDQPNNVKPIGCKWIYKRKRDQAGKVHTFKARLMAKGYTQKEGVDYEETFSPVAMLKSIRILLSIATFYDYEISQMDVKTAFLNGNLENSKKGILSYRYGIHLSKEQCPKTPQEVEDMSNIPYASVVRSLIARKSISGSVFTLNGGAVVWRSIKQSCIADSTMEAEYIATCEAAKEALQIHENLEVITKESTLNESTILSRKSYIEEMLQ
ncbi:gag/pol protein [Cucumis melo var. makuwa]|uniref:Gag/pol protein n=1 Tax=Cucumis melo var. makuwa TaxID=1194695 RepID=A0A5A7TWX1_CUCMM|nr:gag/pol protein [Cucumis melo var. makuwa]